MKRALLGIAVVVVTGCSSLRPVAIQAGATCYRCRRPIEQIRLAGEMVDQNKHAFTFRTAGCMAKYLIEHAEDPAGVFVTDNATGKLIKAQTALFVKATIDPKTNERDFVAFGNVTTAVSFATQNFTTPVDWMSVMAQTRAAAKGN